MTKIKFTGCKAINSTHRISDGAESVWFTWPAGFDEDEVCAQYEDGYDHNGSAADVRAVIYDMDDDAVMSWTF
jgi:hypothetical protein